MEEKKENGNRRKHRTAADRRFAAGVIAGALAVCIAITGIWCVKRAVGYFFGSGFETEEVSAKDLENKLDRISRLIDKYYLYGDEVDPDELIEGIYSGYAAALGDPYTTYYDEEETTQLLESNSGEFSGIGVVASQNTESGVIEFVKIYPDSPAEKAGIQEGDILSSVDGKSTDGEDIETAVSWIRGEEGTEVVLGVIRDGEETQITVTRDTVEMQTVESRMLEEQIGYIRISEFDLVTCDQFQSALEDLEAQDMEGLVIDLRSNPGGSLSAVTDILKLLLPEGIITSIRDKDGNVEEIRCDGDHEFQKPLAVLVNGNSASASELFSGAIQDYGIGKIVGTTTYGKGVVQQIIDLGDGTSLKLTIAEYLTPDGRSINGEGITPDIEVEYVYDENDPEADNQLDEAVSAVLEQTE